MATIAERLLEAIRYRPLDDDVLAKRLGISQRQSIDQVARRLGAEGRLRRYVGHDGKIVNELAEVAEKSPLAEDANFVPQSVGGDAATAANSQIEWNA